MMALAMDSWLLLIASTSGNFDLEIKISYYNNP